MTSNRVARHPSESWTSASTQITTTATVSSIQVRSLRTMNARYCVCDERGKTASVTTSETRWRLCASGSCATWSLQPGKRNKRPTHRRFLESGRRGANSRHSAWTGGLAGKARGHAGSDIAGRPRFHVPRVPVPSRVDVRQIATSARAAKRSPCRATARCVACARPEASGATGARADDGLTGMSARKIGRRRLHIGSQMQAILLGGDARAAPLSVGSLAVSIRTRRPRRPATGALGCAMPVSGAQPWVPVLCNPNAARGRPR